VRDIVYSPDGTWIATAGEDGQISIAGLNGSGHVVDVQQLTAHAGAVRAITFSTHSESLLSAGEDGLVTEWKLPITVKPVSSMVARHERGVWAIAASGNGQWVASAGQSGEVMITERSGSEFREVARVRLDTRVRSLAFIDGNHAVAVGSEDGSLAIWQFRNGPSDVRKIDTGHKRVLSIAVHPDGSMLATAGDDRVARVWPIEPDGNLGSAVLLEGHEGAVNDVAFSPDGERLLTASADRSVRIWRRYTRGTSTPIILQQHDSWIWAAAFSPDGSRLATASEDRTAQIWRTRMSTMAEDVCDAVGDRLLNRDEWAQHVGVDVDYDTEYASCRSAPAAPGVAAVEFLRDVNP
jgi:WD40 repeat protein